MPLKPVFNIVSLHFIVDMSQIFLFDVDGVLIRQGEMFSQRYCREFRFPIEKMLPFFHGIFQECMLGRADLKEVLPPYMAEWGWKGLLDELLEYWFSSESDVDTAVVETVDRLRQKGVRSFIATNNEKYRVMYLWERLGFKDHFDGAFSSPLFGVKKPSIQFFDGVFKALSSYDRDEILFCDNEDENIAAAREYGFQAHLFTNIVNFRREFADMC